MTHLSFSLRSKNKRGTIGIIFPNTQAGSTVVIGKPIQSPTGTAPLNSTTGSAEIRAKTPTSGSPKDWKYFAIFWPIWRCSTTAASFALAASAGGVLDVANARTESTVAVFDRIFLFKDYSSAKLVFGAHKMADCWDQ